MALVPDESDYGDSVGEDAIERSIGAILVGLEEYFVDYGFFIGWDQGKTSAAGSSFRTSRSERGPWRCEGVVFCVLGLITREDFTYKKLPIYDF